MYQGYGGIFLWSLDFCTKFWVGELGNGMGFLWVVVELSTGNISLSDAIKKNKEKFENIGNSTLESGNREEIWLLSFHLCV